MRVAIAFYSNCANKNPGRRFRRRAQLSISHFAKLPDFRKSARIINIIIDAGLRRGKMRCDIKHAPSVSRFRHFVPESLMYVL
jgi:hypothetical protein